MENTIQEVLSIVDDHREKIGSDDYLKLANHCKNLNEQREVLARKEVVKLEVLEISHEMLKQTDSSMTINTGLKKKTFYFPLHKLRSTYDDENINYKPTIKFLQDQIGSTVYLNEKDNKVYLFDGEKNNFDMWRLCSHCEDYEDEQCEDCKYLYLINRRPMILTRVMKVV